MKFNFLSVNFKHRNTIHEAASKAKSRIVDKNPAFHSNIIAEPADTFATRLKGRKTEEIDRISAPKLSTSVLQFLRLRFFLAARRAICFDKNKGCRKKPGIKLSPAKAKRNLFCIFKPESVRIRDKIEQVINTVHANR